LPRESAIATLLTMVEVDADDPAFAHPIKPIGPVYDQVTANRLESEKGWAFRADGNGLRRVVPSPLPRQIPGIHQIEWLLERACVVICTGGGGIPTVRVFEPGDERGRLAGIEGVIDKDRASALLAEQLRADALIIATDVDALYDAWGTPDQRAVRHAPPDLLGSTSFADGSMGPKVAAACAFARRRGTFAAFGKLEDVSRMLRRAAGTIIETEAHWIEYDPPLGRQPSDAREPDDLTAPESSEESMIPLCTAPIVVGYDGSGKARHAIECAGALFPGRRAIIACVWGLSFELRAVYQLAAPIVYDEDVARDHAEELSAEGCRIARAAGLDAVAETVPARNRDLARSLLDVADERRASLVALGAFERNGLQVRIRSALSEGVLRHSRHALLIVPAPPDVAIEPSDGELRRPGALL
jgi:nucleotide-binding universal stress UspA family protein